MGKKRYRLYDADKGKYRLLTSSKGKTYRDSSSAAWDAVYAKQNKKGKFKVLLDGEGKKEGKAQLWGADRKGEIVSKSRWFGSGAKLRKWEKKSGLELDSSDQLGTTTDPITGNRYISRDSLDIAPVFSFTDGKIYDDSITNLSTGLSVVKTKVEFDNAYLAYSVSKDNESVAARQIFRGDLTYSGDELTGALFYDAIVVSGSPSDQSAKFSIGDFFQFKVPLTLSDVLSGFAKDKDNLVAIDSYDWFLPDGGYATNTTNATYEQVISNFESGSLFQSGWWSQSLEDMNALAG